MASRPDILICRECGGSFRFWYGYKLCDQCIGRMMSKRLRCASCGSAWAETGGIRSVIPGYKAQECCTVFITEEQWTAKLITEEKVSQPSHYKSGDLEAIDVIENFDLGFHLGNVVKYILRAGKKDDIVLDLKKARWYLDRHIENVTRSKGGR